MNGLRKKQIKCEFVLRKVITPDTRSLLKSLPIERLRSDPKAMNFLIFGSNEREITRWPWRIVALSNALGTYCTLVLLTTCLLYR